MPLSRIARCIRLYRLRRSGVDFSVDDLSEMLLVSRRTIFRDLKTLEQASSEIDRSECPENTEAPTPFAPGVPFTVEEVIALAISAKFSPLQSIRELRSDLNSALSKLLLGTGEKVRAQIARLVNSCHLDDISASAAEETTQRVLKTVLSAIQLSQSVHLTFDDKSSGLVQSTKVKPERLSASPQGWHISGRSTLHRGTAELNLEVISDAKIV